MTVKVVLAPPPVPPSLELTTDVELVFIPVLVPITLTENEQLAPEVTAAPARLMLPPPATAAMVPPPHDPVRPFGVAMTSPAGRLSVNPTPVRGSSCLDW